jgi:hypothetical protein
VFKDRNEIRKSAQAIWSWIEELNESENKKLEFPPLPTTGLGKLATGSANASSPNSTINRMKRAV